MLLKLFLGAEIDSGCPGQEHIIKNGQPSPLLLGCRKGWRFVAVITLVGEETMRSLLTLATLLLGLAATVALVVEGTYQGGI